MEELKMIIAGNIGSLRRDAGITQLELAEKLNYSDKAVSKWERGESVPDIVTLKAVADLFDVSVDYLLRADHPLEVEVKREYTKRQRRNHTIITVIHLPWCTRCSFYRHQRRNEAGCRTRHRQLGQATGTRRGERGVSCKQLHLRPRLFHPEAG